MTVDFSKKTPFKAKTDFSAESFTLKAKIKHEHSIIWYTYINCLSINCYSNRDQLYVVSCIWKTKSGTYCGKTQPQEWWVYSSSGGATLISLFAGLGITWVPLPLQILGRTDKAAQIVWQTVSDEVNLLWTVLRTTWLHIKHIPGSKARSQCGHLLSVCLIRKPAWGLTIEISHCSHNTPESRQRVGRHVAVSCQCLLQYWVWALGPFILKRLYNATAPGKWRYPQ